jgi:GTPase SAR1 family protein
MAEHECKVALIGPSRVGKTSIITALYIQSREQAAGSPVKIEPGDASTKKRLALYQDEMAGFLALGEFNPAAITGGQSKAEFRLEMSVGKSKLLWSILDYPGGWLGDSDSFPEDWKECEDWINASSVLLIPVDASIIMEATSGAEKRAAAIKLQVFNTTEVAVNWVKARRQKQEPGLLIFVPVKCETYFTDNKGRGKDRSDELLESIKKIYSPFIKAVKSEIDATPGAKVVVEYHPIDTVGTVEIKFTQWENLTATEADKIGFRAAYLVRPPGELNPKGADDLLTAICRQIVDEKGNKNANRNVVARFWKWMSGENKALREAIEKISSRKPGQRVVKDFF